MSASFKKRFLEYAFALCLIGILAAIILPTVSRTCGGMGGRRMADASNLRQIGQASLIYAQDHQDRLPDATDIWGYARTLAESTGLNDGRMWQSRIDPASGEISSEKIEILLPVKIGRPSELNPAFRKIKPAFAVPVGRRLSVNHPATTPIAWTRGLQSDGTWAKHSPYGTDGGYIVFLGGNVAFYRNLSEDGGQLISRDGTKTANTLDALPPGCRISEYQPSPEEQTQWSRQAAQQQ
jgi:type II secretory pathway pseudopilin PulG